MKKNIAFIIGGILLVAIIGTIIYFSSLSYDTATFGDDIIVYGNVDSLSIVVTAELEGKEFYIIPQNREKIVEVISRGDGKRKKVSSAYEGEGDRVVISFDKNVRVTIANDPERGNDQKVAGTNDLAYITYTNLLENTENYYTLEGLALYKNVCDVAGEKAKNIQIAEYDGDKDVIKSLTEATWKKIEAEGFSLVMENSKSEYLKKKATMYKREHLSSQSRIKAEGAFKSLEAVSVYAYAGLGDEYAFVVGDAVFEKGFETFMMIFDGEGELIDCTLKYS